MTSRERSLEMRVAALERRLSRFESAVAFMDEWADTEGSQMVADLARLQGAVSLLVMANEPDPIGVATDLEVAKIEHDLGLPPVEREGE